MYLQVIVCDDSFESSVEPEELRCIAIYRYFFKKIVYCTQLVGHIHPVGSQNRKKAGVLAEFSV